MKRPTAAKLHDDLLSRFMPLLPPATDAPAYRAGEEAGVPFFARVGALSPHSDALVMLVLWPGEGGKAVTLKQWIARRDTGEFVCAPYETGTLRLPSGRREAFERLLHERR